MTQTNVQKKSILQIADTILAPQLLFQYFLAYETHSATYRYAPNVKSSRHHHHCNYIFIY